MTDLLTKVLRGALTGATAEIAREQVNAQPVATATDITLQLEILPTSTRQKLCDRAGTNAGCEHPARVRITGDANGARDLCPWHTIASVWRFIFPTLHV